MGSVRSGAVELVASAGPVYTAGVLGSALAVLTYGLVAAPVIQARYIHLVLGLLWTGGNLVLGVVIGPALAQLDDEPAGAFYARAAPRLGLLLPALLVTVIGIGLPLSIRMQLFDHAAPWLALVALAGGAGVLAVFGWRFDAWRDRRWLLALAAVVVASLGGFAATASQFGMVSTSMFLTLVVGTLIAVVGLGLILANDVRAVLEARSTDPDPGFVASLGRQNAWFARVQILLQLFIVVSVL